MVLVLVRTTAMSGWDWEIQVDMSFLRGLLAHVMWAVLVCSFLTCIKFNGWWRHEFPLCTSFSFQTSEWWWWARPLKWATALSFLWSNMKKTQFCELPSKYKWNIRLWVSIQVEVENCHLTRQLDLNLNPEFAIWLRNGLGLGWIYTELLNQATRPSSGLWI